MGKNATNPGANEFAKNNTATDTPKVAEAKPATDTPKVAKAKPAYITFLAALIAEGKYTQKELKAKGWEKFPEVAKSTIETVLVDSKNPKYNRFPKLVVKSDKGLLAFAK
jgi:hypothetical protein